MARETLPYWYRQATSTALSAAGGEVAADTGRARLALLGGGVTSVLTQVRPAPKVVFQNAPQQNENANKTKCTTRL